MNATVDTNVLVRLATGDEPEQAASAFKALQQASLIAVPAVALCELVWVLMRGYRYNASQAAHAVRILIQVQQVVCDAPTVVAGLSMLEAGGDFADGVIAFEGERLGGVEFVTFDKAAAQRLKRQNRLVKLLR